MNIKYRSLFILFILCIFMNNIALHGQLTLLDRIIPRQKKYAENGMSKVKLKSCQNFEYLKCGIINNSIVPINADHRIA